MKAETEPIHSQQGNPGWKIGNRWKESRQLTTNKNSTPNHADRADRADRVRSCKFLHDLRIPN
jgi:hypothetical protein